MNTETKTMPEQEVAPAKTDGWGEWLSDTFSSITGSKDTVESLETERKKYNDKIDARLNKLQAADVNVADSKGTVNPSADDMGGGRRRRRTKRSKRSKKTKRRRGKRSGKRTRR